MHGKVALVTGAGRGIGRELALALADRGAAVAVADRGVELDGSDASESVAEVVAAEIHAAGGSALASTADVGDRTQVDELMEAIIAKFGRLDVVVNTAGIMRKGSLADATPGDLQATLDVHVTGAFNVVQAALARWQGTVTHGRRVINIGSDSGFYGEPDYLCYATAKAALSGLTASCAPPMRAVGATCNLYVPQALTRMTASIPQDELPDPDRWAAGEFSAANVLPALLYLLSDEGGSVHGATIAGFGFEVHLYSQPARVRSIYSAGVWDDEVLARRMRETFEPLVRG